MFLMIYEIIMGVFDHLKDGFWGYYNRITERINRYTKDAAIYGEDEILVKTLGKQKQELEDIMSQYVFYRYCEKLSVYLTQIDAVLAFCLSIATVIYVHSAFLNREYFWMTLWILAYAYYIWREVSGTFIRFEVWATNIFLKQYKVLTRSGSAGSIVDSKKSNKRVLRRLYLFLILPLTAAALIVLKFFVIYPLLPVMNYGLQAGIFKMWGIFALCGTIFVAVIPVFLDRVLNARLKIRLEMFSDVRYAVYIYLFLSLLLSTGISIARYSI
jgi:hypothetical protein